MSNKDAFFYTRDFYQHDRRDFSSMTIDLSQMTVKTSVQEKKRKGLLRKQTVIK